MLTFDQQLLLLTYFFFLLLIFNNFHRSSFVVVVVVFSFLITALSHKIINHDARRRCCCSFIRKIVINTSSAQSQHTHRTQLWVYGKTNIIHVFAVLWVLRHFIGFCLTRNGSSCSTFNISHPLGRILRLTTVKVGALKMYHVASSSIRSQDPGSLASTSRLRYCVIWFQNINRPFATASDAPIVPRGDLGCPRKSLRHCSRSSEHMRAFPTIVFSNESFARSLAVHACRGNSFALTICFFRLTPVLGCT